MGWTGVIYAIFAIGWLTYLIPYFVQRRGLEADAADEAYESGTITIIRSGTDLATANEEGEDVQRNIREQLLELSRTEAKAVASRRRVLVGLILVNAVVSGLYLGGLISWWGALIPATLLLAYLPISAIAAKRMRSRLQKRAAEIKQGGNVASAVTLTPQAELVADTPQVSVGQQRSVDLHSSVGAIDLLATLPVAPTSHYSRPAPPRTVRTIKLDAPAASGWRSQVSLDAPLEDTELRKAS